MRKQKIIVYTGKTERFETLAWPKEYSVMYAHPKYFGAALDTIDGIWSNNEAIINAYAKVNVPVITLPGETPKEQTVAFVEQESEVVDTISEVTEDVTEEVESLESDFNMDDAIAAGNPSNEPADESESETSEEGDEFPIDWRDLSWAKLRGVASSYSDGAVKNKAEAYEVMERVEANLKGE